MTSPIITVENLSKRYHLGQIGATTLRDSAQHLVDRLRHAVTRHSSLVTTSSSPVTASPSPGTDPNDLWALRDVCFDVQPGEVLGIIGRNGAGKSTLLKILSRITEPTSGRAVIRGRVASLLEVGTGFHPELTGRENIFLNGAILGMRKAEIARKFDEIVAFAEVAKFIDTPVKRYSSGMYVRLAFAVAAHLEPEILVVDEVLAVGDVEFQKKCLGKMGDVARQGRTVLFVSHNLAAVKMLCPQTMLLIAGTVAFKGSSAEAIAQYMSNGKSSPAMALWDDIVSAPGNDVSRLHRVSIEKADGGVYNDFDTDTSFVVAIEYWALQEGHNIGATVVVYNDDGVCVFSSLSSSDPQWAVKPTPVGLSRSRCLIFGGLLSPGRYTVTVLLWADNFRASCRVEQVVEFKIIEGAGARGNYLGGWAGVVRPVLQWSTALTPDGEIKKGD